MWTTLEVKSSEEKIKQSKDDRGDTVFKMIRKVSETNIDPDLKDASKEATCLSKGRGRRQGARECQGREMKRTRLKRGQRSHPEAPLDRWWRILL